MYDRIFTEVNSWCHSRVYNASHHMGKPTICIGENKGADQPSIVFILLSIFMLFSHSQVDMKKSS